jgi:putative tricarboxylic transport membrane protein
MIITGLILSTVGMDPISGKTRFTFGCGTLIDGIGLVPAAMGLFGISEVLMNLEESLERVIFKAKIKNLLPNLEDWKKSIGPIMAAGNPFRIPSRDPAWGGRHYSLFCIIRFREKDF